MSKRLQAALELAVAVTAVFHCFLSGGICLADSEPSLLQATATRIRGGEPTFEFPAVGALSVQGSLCTVTLIGCETVLTAAHCVCPDGADDTYARCAARSYDPEDMSFFFQHAGFFTGRSVVINRQFEFTEGGDLAIVKLSEPVTGIQPQEIDTSRSPNDGTTATVVGFGTTGEFAIIPPGVGVKRIASVVTSDCGTNVRAKNHVCNSVAPGAPSVCMGDSGGPLFVDFGDGPVVAGVASGASGLGALFCTTPFLSFSTDVYRYRSFIRDELGDDADTGPCGDLPPVGSPEVIVHQFLGDLGSKSSELRGEFDVPQGTQLMRVIMNGVILTGQERNDFDLFVRQGAEPTAESYDCADERNGAFAICEINGPPAGSWHLLVERTAGEGEMQVTVTLFTDPNAPTHTPRPTATRTPPPPTRTQRPIPTGPVDDCVGDCDENGTVILPELVYGLGIALGYFPVDSCGAFDFDGDGTVGIGELVNAVEATLRGCAERP